MSARFMQNRQDTGITDAPIFDVPVMLQSIDHLGTITQVSTYWAATLGYAPEDMIGRNSLDFMDQTSRDHMTFTALPQLTKSGEVSGVELDFVRQNGLPLHVLMSGKANFDADGTYRRTSAVFFDNSEAKRARALLNRELRDKAVGKLAAGVAHDFNNLLSVILGNLEFLRDMPDHPEAPEMIKDALAATQRGAVLTGQLVAYGRRAQLSPKAQSLDGILHEMGEIFLRILPPSIPLIVELAPNLPMVTVDRQQLETALINIIDNAREAMPSGGQIKISARAKTLLQAPLTVTDDDLPPGDYVAVSIQDTGTGMPDNIKSEIFQPFFTTKAVGKGSGLGLSMVFGFVRQSNGAVQVTSAPGRGTTITLLLPVRRPALVREKTTPIASPGPVQQAEAALEVLLVEDQPELRHVLAGQIRAAGHRVVEATHGDGAHRLLLHGLRPDLVVTDLTMPGRLQGDQLLAIAQKMFPGLRGIVISGHLNPQGLAGDDGPKDALWLTKPVSREKLLACLHGLSASAPTAVDQLMN